MAQVGLDRDQLDVPMVVRILLKDRYVIDNKRKLWEILDIPYADIKAAEGHCSTDVSTIEDLFTRMLHIWVSRTNGSLMDLISVLNDNGFTRSAGEYNNFDFEWINLLRDYHALFQFVLYQIIFDTIMRRLLFDFNAS
jgi:hypothetical protein